MVIIVNMRVSRKKGVPQNGWIIMRNHIKMDDLGVPPFMETSNCIDSSDENKLVLSTWNCYDEGNQNYDHDDDQHEYDRLSLRLKDLRLEQLGLSEASPSPKSQALHLAKNREIESLVHQNDLNHWSIRNPWFTSSSDFSDFCGPSECHPVPIMKLCSHWENCMPVLRASQTVSED